MELWSLLLLGTAHSLGLELVEAVLLTVVSGELAYAKKCSVRPRLQRGIPFLHHNPVPMPALHPPLLFGGSG